MTDKQLIETGKIINTHGVKGAVKIEVWSDDSKIFSSVKRFVIDGVEYEKESASIGGRFPIVKLKGIETPEDAAKYKEKVIYVYRQDIKVPKGKILICDMIGLDVIDINTNKKLGVLVDVLDYSPNKIYQIKDTKGKEVLLPEVKEFIKKIDDTGIYISPIEGFFDEI
jgi:16S rRNA processing protein RimM